MRPLLKGMKGRPLTGRRGQARAGNTVAPSWPSAYQSVHPRSRGEHGSGLYVLDNNTGSSPLARGTLEFGRDALQEIRFIPARAGNTCPTRRRSRTGSVHPRSRGEHWESKNASPACAGSSPLARGTRQPGSAATCSARFIPARAGNTPPATARRSAPTVHPRSRGEHRTYQPRVCTNDGSSPLARGTRLRPRDPLIQVRFIPARAGNTVPS